MQREILFRGKRVNNGEWVEGMVAYFFDSPKNAMIMPKCYFGTKDFGEEDDDGNPIIEDEIALGGFVNVHPESVGQFTGLLDKNGKRIFEGDILNLTYDGHSFNCEVKYSDGGFLVFENNGFNSGDADMTLIGWLKHDDYRYEVIGNIHDNPTLIK